MKMMFFRADWCNPCRQMSPIVSDLMDQDYMKDRYTVEYINIDEDPEITAKWGVRGIPTFIIVDDRGQEAARHCGALPKTKLQEWMIDSYRSPLRAATLGGDHSPIPYKEKPNMLTTIKKMLGLTQDEPVIGSIELWAGYSSRVPVGYARCEGQRMSIRENPALYSLIGVTYGGDGREYFNLPDYRPRDNKGNPLPWDPSKSPVVLICIQGMYPQMD